jgi:hypothetical protein
MMGYPLFAYRKDGQPLDQGDVICVAVHHWLVILSRVFRDRFVSHDDLAWAAAINDELKRVS